MSTTHRDKFNNIENFLQDSDKFDVKRCLEDMDYEDTFPEDMCESRTDWEELKDRKEKAQRTVHILLDIIDSTRTTMCGLCKQNAQMKADASWILSDEPHTPCRDCPWKEISPDAESV